MSWTSGFHFFLEFVHPILLFCPSSKGFSSEKYSITGPRQDHVYCLRARSTIGLFGTHRSFPSEIVRNGTPSAESCSKSDLDVIEELVRELGINPPWEQPDCSTRTFNFLLNQLVDSQHPLGKEPGQEAEKVLRYMIKQGQQGRSFLKPDVFTLNIVLAGYAKNPPLAYRVRQKRAEAAWRMLKEWGELWKLGAVSMEADRISYNTVMTAFAAAGETSRAETVFSDLKARHNESGSDLMGPDIVSYSTLLRSYAVTGKPDKSERVLRLMEEDHVQPSIHCFNNVLHAYAKSNRPSEALAFLKRWIEKNDKHLEYAAEPDLQSWNIVLHALAQTRDSSCITKVDEFFETMPFKDQVSYTTLIAAYCRNLSGELAISSVDRVIQRARTDDSVQLNASFLCNALYSIASIEDKTMPTFAEQTIRDFEKAGVDITTSVFNALIYCWAKSNDRESSVRVLEILAKLERDEKFKPDVRTYTNVLDSFKGKGPEAISAAEAILSKMERSGPTPNAHAYTALIQIYSRSKLPFKAMKAASILERMKKANPRPIYPTIVTYNAVLNACEYTDPSDRVITEEALKVACLTFDEIRSSSVKANFVTYGSFLGALAVLMPVDTRQEIVELVFKRCCLDGQVSKLVLKKLREAAGSEVKYKQLLQGRDEKQLPPSWTSQARETKVRYEA